MTQFFNITLSKDTSKEEEEEILKIDTQIQKEIAEQPPQEEGQEDEQY